MPHAIKAWTECTEIVCSLSGIKMKETVEAAWVATIEERVADLERCIATLEKNREADQKEIAELRRLHDLRQKLRLGVCGVYTLFSNGNSMYLRVLDDGSPIVTFVRYVSCRGRSITSMSHRGRG